MNFEIGLGLEVLVDSAMVNIPNRGNSIFDDVAQISGGNAQGKCLQFNGWAWPRLVHN